MPYNDAVNNKQALSETPVDILELAEEMPREVSPPDQVEDFRTRYLSKPDQTRLLWAIITLWEGKNRALPQITALEAFYWLKVCGFTKARQTPSQPALWMESFVERQRAIAEGTPPPEPPTPLSGAIKPPSEEFLRTVANARQKREVAA